ncbi:MAG: DUF5700 domain-containing putative Zn-dependent protease [Terracidiphilus sp.]
MPSISRTDRRVQLTVDATQAEAALAIAECWNTGLPVQEQHWLALLTSEGHRRWKRRMEAVGQPVDDTEYARFLLSVAVGKQLKELWRTLRTWQKANWEEAALRAIKWLPEDARILAGVFVVFTPAANSFYYAEDDNAAVIFSLDAALSWAEFENRMVHELHHVGYFGLARNQPTGIPFATQSAVEWTRSFAEGLAMLAAAGGADVHPHATSPTETRARWDREIADFEHSRCAIEQFLLDVVNQRKTTEEELKAGHALLGVQGPWYTVGWMMGAIVEREFGRQVLLDCMAEVPQLMARYNQAAPTRDLTLWSHELMAALT